MSNQETESVQHIGDTIYRVLRILLNYCRLFNGIHFKFLFTRGQFHLHSTYSFYACGSQKRKKTVKLSIFFTLSGSTNIKAVCKVLVKLTPGLFGGTGALRFFPAELIELVEPPRIFAEDKPFPLL